jgi:hypothetical protein
MLLVSSVGSIIDEILLVRARVVLVKKEGCQGAAPLMLETVRACVEVAIEYVMPETWRRACGDEVPMPMLPV